MEMLTQSFLALRTVRRPLPPSTMPLDTTLLSKRYFSTSGEYDDGEEWALLLFIGVERTVLSTSLTNVKLRDGLIAPLVVFYDAQSERQQNVMKIICLFRVGSLLRLHPGEKSYSGCLSSSSFHSCTHCFKEFCTSQISWLCLGRGRIAYPLPAQCCFAHSCCDGRCVRNCVWKDDDTRSRLRFICNFSGGGEEE